MDRFHIMQLVKKYQKEHLDNIPFNPSHAGPQSTGMTPCLKPFHGGTFPLTGLPWA